MLSAGAGFLLTNAMDVEDEEVDSVAVRAEARGGLPRDLLVAAAAGVEEEVESDDEEVAAAEAMEADEEQVAAPNGRIFTRAQLEAQAQGQPPPVHTPDRVRYCPQEMLSALLIAETCPRTPDRNSPINTPHFLRQCLRLRGTGRTGVYAFGPGWPERTGNALGNICRKNIVVMEDGTFAWLEIGHLL